MHLVDVVQHGLGPGEHLATDRTGTAASAVLLLDVPVQGLDEGRPHTAHVTLPRLVIFMIFVHVIHQSPEASTLLITNFTDAELLVVLGYFLLGHVAHLPSLGRLVELQSRPASLPGPELTEGTQVSCVSISSKLPTSTSY